MVRAVDAARAGRLAEALTVEPLKGFTELPRAYRVSS
jgi:hypothetical protein